MERALFCLMLGALGCQPEMASMMEDGPADGGRPDVTVSLTDGAIPFDADPGPLRINHLQMRATVNSYHDVNHGVDPELMDYVHLPLDRQAAEQGIRVFDFDIVPDRQAGIDLHPAVSDHPLDDLNHCGDLLRCLYPLDDWMDAHPEHPLVVVLIGEAFLFATSHGLHFQLDDVESSMLLAIGRERILTPADVRGDHPDLRTALAEDGWPTVEETRGMAMFVLNDRGLPRTFYLDEGGEDPADPLLFQVGDPNLVDDPNTRDEVVFTFEPDLDGEEWPWFFETDPADLGRIVALVRNRYLVHATSDAPEMQARLRAAGAHFIGTRYPDTLGPVPAEGPTVCNPVSRTLICDPALIEPR